MISLRKPSRDVAGFAAEFIESATGIIIPEYRRDVVETVLAKLGQGDPVSGLNMLVAGDLAARTAVHEAVAISETYFFRHPGHFEALRKHAALRKAQGAPFHVLSAGCSSGEEAWSAAAVLASEYLPDGRFSVSCWDLCRARLEIARQGIYRPWSFRQGFFGLDKFFVRTGENFSVHFSLRPFVSFLPVNLLEPLPMGRQFDAIIFRNVSIYWSRQQANDIAHALSQRLAPGGLFLIGPSDPVRFDPEQWDFEMGDGLCLYRKKNLENPIPAANAKAPVERKAPVYREAQGTLSVSEFDTLDRVKTLSDEGRLSDALDLLQRMPGAKTTERRYWEGIINFSMGRLETALPLFQQCVYLEPDVSIYRRWLAIALEAAGQPAAAARERTNAEKLEARIV